MSPPIHPLASSQGAVFLVNSCQRYFRCVPPHFWIQANYFYSLKKFQNWGGKALSRSYGCFFAEFLGDHSLVRLGLIDLITCVGLRYGFYIFKFRDFSWKRALYHYPPPKWKTFCFSFMRHLRQCTDFPIHHNQDTNFKSNNERYILPSVIPSQNTEVWEY